MEMELNLDSDPISSVIHEFASDSDFEQYLEKNETGTIFEKLCNEGKE